MTETLRALWPITDLHRFRFGRAATFVLVAVGVLGIGVAYLPWAYGADAMDDLSFLGGPSGVQFMGLALAAILAASALALLLAGRPGTLGQALGRVCWSGAAKAVATGWLVFMAITVAIVALELGGLVNVEYGGWIGVALAVIGWLASRFLEASPAAVVDRGVLPAPIEIVLIAALMGAALFAGAYGLDVDDAGVLVVLVVLIAVVSLTLNRSGLGGYLAGVTRRHRPVLVFAAFAVAFAFPFTQDGSNANMSIATQIVIFAVTALGLNIVVGLAGLLDLGYIAFLAAGAFTAATLSRSAFARSTGIRRSRWSS